MWKRYLLALALVAVATLGACTGYRHEAYRMGERSKVTEEEFELHFVEADDEGWFWNPQQANDAVNAVAASAAQQNTFVLLFVHGWHHSARCCDDNVESVKETLDRLHKELNKPANRAARGEARSEQFKLIGIYVGWRGKSLPGWLNFFTFWGRKSAAERIGETDVREFIARLNQVYLEQGQDKTLGLISIGHSFGGQALLRSTAATLEENLLRRNPPPGYLRQDEPVAGEGDRVGLQGIGDLVVLLNPATEAAAYHRLHLLSMGLRYEPWQTPVMLTFSAENDTSRHSLFTIGRRIGEFFTGKPRKSDPAEREMERKALGIDGEYVAHVTHTLEPVDDRARLIAADAVRTPEPYCEGKDRCVARWLRWADDPDRLNVENSVSARTPNFDRFDLSAEVTLGNVTLKPGAGHIPYQPLIVVRTSSAIIDDHSGIFTEPFLQFLIPYIALIESKTALNPKESFDRRQEAL